ncbi:COX15/CtaA family protein [Methylocapsa palsarum]|uniref:Heme A synthase n=1 Tax=Methylocapsa palsarum TaxID=1612308 RepID=A0A1I3W6F7_9HYPH|nr:COX15/CtaA family protein [Methylocapsa palsarum]SFK03168.1 cytochrome c oxidase assembly protein subunit 15 [Methylocapsa palsarum]
MTELAYDPAGAARSRSRASGLGRAVAIWLWGLAALIFLMVVVGGATRLTESGLSITQWKPLTGIVPPLSQADWLAEFENYKRIPQYSEVFPDMDLGGFRFIFFWEWSHRLLGRVIGLATLLPLIFFWAKGALSFDLKAKLLGILALGGLQGFVGWWMVKSGLSGRVEVAQERLAIHLLLASVTFAAVVWIASSLKDRPAEVPTRVLSRLKGFSAGILALVLTQIGLGALVAGLRAGRVFNTWPLMEGHIAPPLDQLTSLSPLWRNFVDNMVLAQFQHRMTAYALLALALSQALYALRYVPATRSSRRAVILACAVATQLLIGVATLVLAVPLWAGLLHQAAAIVVLGLAAANAEAIWAERSRRMA